MTGLQNKVLLSHLPSFGTPSEGTGEPHYQLMEGEFWAPFVVTVGMGKMDTVFCAVWLE